MKKAPFIIKKLSVQNLPGFPRGVGNFSDLSPGINILTGPNASGKSSVARLIRNLIWKIEDGSSSADCSVEIGKTAWHIKTLQGKIKIQREGVDDELKGVPSAETSGRYMLALHELIVADEAGLAKLIAKESVGGFDLEAAAAGLDYSSAIKPSTIREYQDFIKSQGKYRETEQKQRELKQEEEDLQALYRERSLALEAAGIRDYYTLVRDCLVAKLNYEANFALYQEFSPSLGKMTGEEDSDIESLEQEIREAVNEREIAETEVSRNRKIIWGLEIPSGGVDQAVQAELESRVVLLEKLESDIGDAERKISELHTAAEEALKALGGEGTVADWKGITTVDVSRLDRFLQEMHQALSEKQYLETRQVALSEAIRGKEPADPDKLRQGIKTLVYWLQERRPVNGISAFWIPALSVTAIISALMIWFFGVYGLFFLPVPVIMAILARIKKPGGVNIRESDYKKTGLREIREWTVDEVTEVLEYLVNELQEELHREKTLREIESMNEPLSEVRDKIAQLEKEADRWKDMLTAIPGIPVEELRNYSGMYWFLRHVLDWHNHHSQGLALGAGRDELKGRYEETLERVSSLCSAYALGDAGDAAAARAVYDSFRERISIWKDCMNEIRRQTGIIESGQKQIEKSGKKLSSIYERLDVEPGNIAMVRELKRQLPDFIKVKQELYASRQGMTEKEKLLQGNSRYEKDSDLISSLTTDKVSDMIDARVREAERLEEINRRITETETKINSVRQGHDIEESMADIDIARNRLEVVFEKNLSSVTGKLITEHLKDGISYKSRPALFRRANELFVRITGGRYKLIVDDRGEASFRGFDTAMDLGLDLDELSTGTRIQLLLAVRLAWIESQESSLALPLLADELLANSDDIRAGAIIEALAGISSEGRQVFYFTAQADEVEKWRYHLKGRKDLPFRVIEISVPGAPAGEPGPVPQVAGIGGYKFLHDVPPPGKSDYNEYGKITGVPGYDIVTGEVNGIHLWYILDDSRLLHTCLLSGIRYWGQMETYIDHGGIIEGLGENFYTKLGQRVRLLKRFKELYCTGRPKPINRSVLEASGAITPAFIGAVTGQLTVTGNNPLELINALRAGKVPRFQQAKADELEQFLLTHGYIDAREPVGKDEIMVMINAYISGLDIDRGEAEALINRVLSGGN